MKEAIANLTKESEKSFIALVNQDEHFNLVLSAYNTYCNEEKDGADYIFDLENKNDLIFLIKGGMKTEDIVSLVGDRKSRYIVINERYQYVPMSIDRIKSNIKMYAYEIMESVIYFPYIEEYKNVYQKIISNTYE